MYSYFISKFKLIPLVLAILFTTAACGASKDATPTPKMTPTLAQSSATMTISPTPEPTSTPLPEIELGIELPEGAPQSGFTTAIRYGCHGCHVNEIHPTSGPRFAADAETPFVLQRGTMRIALPEYEGRATTDQEYMIESIFLPEAYIVPGEWKEPMPTSFHQRMTDQELADILAWIASLK